MGYAIVGGSGLFVGIGLMIWALAERSKRHAAERRADATLLELKEMRQLAAKNAAAAQSIRDASIRSDKQLTLVRAQLEDTRRRLARSGDPEAVKAWLDEELKGGPV